MDFNLTIIILCCCLAGSMAQSGPQGAIAPASSIDLQNTEQPIVSGYVYRDLDQDGYFGATDIPMPFQRVIILPQNVITLTDQNGEYHFSLPEGEYEVRYLPHPNWMIDSGPSTYNIIVSSEDIPGLDFIIGPKKETQNLRIYFHEGIPHCSQSSGYAITVINEGTMPENAQLRFINENEISIDQLVPPPTTIEGDTLIWNFTGLLPFATNKISMNINLPAENETIAFQGMVYHMDGKTRVLLDEFNSAQIVSCSLNTNDKTGRSLTQRDTNQNTIDDPLMYTIRFQNIGIDTANTIFIRDTLDDDHLDVSTITITGASHPYRVIIFQGRILEFQFNSIFLPGSHVNEPKSHAFISYSIRPKTGLTAPIEIRNTAHIYFDFEHVLTTNTTLHELGEITTPILSEPKFITVIQAFPNPTSNEIYISALKEIHQEIQFELLNGHGTILRAGSILPNDMKKIELHQYPSGMYILKATDGQGVQSITFIKS